MPRSAAAMTTANSSSGVATTQTSVAKPRNNALRPASVPLAAASGGGICRGRIDYLAHARNAVGGKATLLRMRTHRGLVRGDVDAVDLFIGDEALHPLDLRAHALQHAAGFLGDRLQILHRQLAGSGEFTLDDVLWHCPLLSVM